MGCCADDDDDDDDDAYSDHWALKIWNDTSLK
jgi:hypothetical protein